MRGRWQGLAGSLVLAGFALPAAAAARTQTAAVTAPTASAQAEGPEAWIGLPVTDIRFEVEGRPDPSPVLATNVEVRKGQPYRIEDVRDSIQHLSLRYDEISVTGERTATGVDLVFHLVPRHPINAVAFSITGPTELKPDDLSARFRRAYGGLPTNARIPNAESAVSRVLADLGYLDAVVTSTTVPTHEPERATLVFNITPGEPVRVGQLGITNHSSWTDAVILQRAGVTVGGIYRQRDIQTAMAAMQDELRSEGYYEAVASVTSERRAPDNQEVVSITVDAGARVELRFVGDPLPKGIGSLEDLVPLKREGAADDDLLEASRVRIEARLKSQGYRQGRASYERVAQPDGSVVITYTVATGPRFEIDRVDIPAETVVPARTIEQALKLQSGEPFSDARATAAAARVQMEFQRLGYYEAVVQWDAETVVGRMSGGAGLVVIHLKIVEGPKHTIGAIEFHLAAPTALVSEADLRAAMRLHVGDAYVSTTVSGDLDAIETLYLNRGFRAAVVTIRPRFIPGDRDVRVTLDVTADEGPQITVGSITVVGNERVGEQSIRDDLTLREGAPYGEAARQQSYNTLRQRGVFRQVSIEEEPRLSGETRASVIVSVQELPATTIDYGGGVEVSRKPTTTTTAGLIDNLEFAPRGFFAIGRRTLGGRDRAVNLFTRAALRRRGVPADATVPEEPGYGFSEYRVTGTYRERRAFQTDTELLLGFTAEQGVRTNFNFIRQSASAEALRRITPRLSLSGRYTLDFTRLFDEQIAPEDQFAIDRLFPQVRLSIVGGTVSWDSRNGPVSPTRGMLLSNNFEVALRSIGSQVGYAKNFFQVSAFHSLPTTRRNVLAGRIQVGAADGFKPVTDLPASQRFFAGGGGSVRGFQVDLLGVPEVLTPEGLSNGGNALIVLNAEIRTFVRQLAGRDLVAVAFADGGNIFRRADDLDITRIRGALGFGVRYDSPIGPVRVDFGFKTSRMTFETGQREHRWEYHVSIGEAF